MVGSGLDAAPRPETRRATRSTRSVGPSPPPFHAYHPDVPDYETILYEEVDGVAWITLNRPDLHNAFNFEMQRELKDVWRSLRTNDDVRCAVLTGAGDKAFCVGIDRNEIMGDWTTSEEVNAASATGTGTASGATPWHFDDPGENIGPKSNDLWKPVIAAVNGMACGGAFYMLGEVEFIIAAEHATFFDPHVTFGMTACFESIHMLQKMPFGEIMRVALLGSSERMTAARAHQVGLVSEVVAGDGLRDAAAWAAGEIAKAPATAIQGTVRAIWMARELSRLQALDAAKILIKLGSDPESILEGQQAFASGERIKPRRR
ncbi:MAG: enoyl-CoA hydratase/isomerase family protein [Acidimicrobiia bacterium]|nr:enoyl-CoA hydratase/isomerase family protein [Acidimicrobiia bacterium]